MTKTKLRTNIPHEHKCVTCKQNFSKSDSKIFWKDKMPKGGWLQGWKVTGNPQCDPAQWQTEESDVHYVNNLNECRNSPTPVPIQANQELNCRAFLSLIRSRRKNPTTNDTAYVWEAARPPPKIKGVREGCQLTPRPANTGPETVARTIRQDK